MASIEQKKQFLITDLPAYFESNPTDTAPVFGKMTVQQMVEHFSESVRIASGKRDIKDFITPPEHLDKIQAFMLSDKPFRENTPNPLIGDTAPPLKHGDMAQAISELKIEISKFFDSFSTGETKVTRNPFFGDLDLEKNVHLLYKHALHHLRQFGINP